MKLNEEQSDILFEVTEHHLKWYKKFCKDIPDFTDLLEINHLKIKKHFFGLNDYTEKEVTEELLNLKQKYIDMIVNKNK
jgi:hypothetical protein